jgi:poly(A) polymerase
MEIKEKAVSIIKKLVTNGYVAYFAGGCVRDDLMGHPSYDIDIATNATPTEILGLFPHTIPVGLVFGVIIVVVGGDAFEVSTFRRDINYSNGRKPESIELSNAEEDALRRDFTINGIFYDPLEDIIYDYVGGHQDIKKGIIRTIGNPGERFFEDRLRMIRAVRFSARFGFFIDPETEEGIRENADFLFPAVAMERISQELNKMCVSSHFHKALIDLHRLGLMQVIFPALKDVHLNTIKQQAECFNRFPNNTPYIVYLMEFFPGITSDELKDLCLYLKLSSKEAKLAAFHHLYRAAILDFEHISRKELVYFYANPDSQMIVEIQAAHMQAQEAQHFLFKHQEKIVELLPFIERVQLKKPLITGAHLSNLGIREGKKMGALLKHAELLSIELGLLTEKSVIDLLKKTTIFEEKE